MPFVINSTQFIYSTEQRKAALRELRALLAAAQESQGPFPPATTALIPKPRGTSGRRNFNLANEMGVTKKICRQIQVSALFPHSVYLLTITAGFCSFAREHVKP